jgi:hypothetical protein
LLEYGRAAVAVIRGLEVRGLDMSYADFAHSIGLLGRTAKWQPWHRQQTEAVLKMVAAVEAKAPHQGPRLQYHRIVNQRTGVSGAGIAKNSRIVTR